MVGQLFVLNFVERLLILVQQLVWQLGNLGQIEQGLSVGGAGCQGPQMCLSAHEGAWSFGYSYSAIAVLR